MTQKGFWCRPQALCLLDSAVFNDSLQDLPKNLSPSTFRRGQRAHSHQHHLWTMTKLWSSDDGRSEIMRSMRLLENAQILLQTGKTVVGLKISITGRHVDWTASGVLPCSSKWHSPEHPIDYYNIHIMDFKFWEVISFFLQSAIRLFCMKETAAASFYSSFPGTLLLLLISEVIQATGLCFHSPISLGKE